MYSLSLLLNPFLCTVFSLILLTVFLIHTSFLITFIALSCHISEWLASDIMNFRPYRCWKWWTCVMVTAPSPYHPSTLNTTITRFSQSLSSNCSPHMTSELVLHHWIPSWITKWYFSFWERSAAQVLSIRRKWIMYLTIINFLNILCIVPDSIFKEADLQHLYTGGCFLNNPHIHWVISKYLVLVMMWF